MAGDLTTVDMMVRPLADALTDHEQVVRTAISVTKAQQDDAARMAAHEAERAWRAFFRPYATIVTETQ